MAFSSEQIGHLRAPLSSAAVKSRTQSGRTLSYVEGWHVIAEANRIFGFDGWTSETIDVRPVAERERRIGRPPNDKPGWGVSYIAKARVTVDGIVREGVGSGHGIDVDLGLAHESAIKEAETDARKRALMTFGNPFGLALYDKEQRNVVDEKDESSARFVTECERKIASLTTEFELRSWWASTSEQIPAFGLSDAEGDGLKAKVKARLAALRSAAA